VLDTLGPVDDAVDERFAGAWLGLPPVVVGDAVDAAALVMTPDSVVVDVDGSCCTPTLPLPVAAAELHTLGPLDDS
jgi:hypothetical protein